MEPVTAMVLGFFWSMWAVAFVNFMGCGIC
jgi:hypothetical protein